MNKPTQFLATVAAGLFGMAGAVAADPLPAVSGYGQIDCHEFSGDSVSGSVLEYDLSCSEAAGALPDMPASSARASLAQAPVMQIDGAAAFAAGTPSGDAFYASSNVEFQYYYRLNLRQPPPFEPAAVPLLWVTSGSAAVQGEVIRFFAYSQFVDETGQNVATYLSPDDTAFQRLRPYLWYPTASARLVLQAECFFRSSTDGPQGCSYNVKGYPIFDQAAFDATQGAQSFALADYYELEFSAGVSFVADIDQDGRGDASDNCTFVANPDQADADQDGFGNLCDADFNNDCIVNVVDLGLLRAGFFSADAVLDLNADGVVNVTDLGLLRTLFLTPPGPSATVMQCRESAG